MREENENYIGEDNTTEIVKRYEEKLSQSKSIFFDVFEFENIIDFYLSDDNHSRTKQAIDIAERIYPNSPEIQIKSPEYYFVKGEFNNSLSLVGVLGESDSQDELYFLKGQVCFELAETQKSIESFDRAIEIGTDDTIELLHRVSSFYLESDEINLALRYLLKSYQIDKTSLGCFVRFGLLLRAEQCIGQKHPLLQRVFRYKPILRKLSTTWALFILNWTI